MAFYSGNYGGPLGRIDTSPITRGAQAQAQMYQNLGNTIASVANVYFKKKEEDKQIDALADNEAVLNHVYGGRVDAAGLPVMPSDPKEVRKDIRALYRRIGPAGIEAATRADKADARARQVLEMQQKAADAAERRSNQQDAEHEFKLRQRDLKMDVFKAAYKGQTIKEKKEVPPSTIGQYFKKAVGGADLSKLAEASGRLGHPLSDAAADEARLSPRLYEANVEAMQGAPYATPEPPPPQTYTSPKPSYLGDMLSKAGEAIGGVEIPGTGKTIRRTREVAPAIESAYSIGDLVDNVMDVPGMTEEHIPYIVELGKSEGLTSMGRSTYGISRKLQKNPNGTPIAYFADSEARRALTKAFIDETGRPPTEAQLKSFVSSAHIVDPVAVVKTAEDDVKAMNLEVPFEILSEMAELEDLIKEGAKGGPQGKGNRTARVAAVKKIARMFDRGPLTKDDVQGFMGGESAYDDAMQTLRDTTGSEWNAGAVENLTKLVAVIKNSATRDMRARVPQIVTKLMNNFSMTEEQVHEHTFLDDMLKAAGGGKPSPTTLTGDAAFEQELAQLQVGGKITHPGVQGELTKMEDRNGKAFLLAQDGQTYPIP